jgi:hypothetical protein
MTTPSAERWPESLPGRPIATPVPAPTTQMQPQSQLGLPLSRTYLWPARPPLVQRAARTWWLALGCWFLGTAVGQLSHGPAALAWSYRYPTLRPGSAGYPSAGVWSLPGPLAVVVFGVVAVFLASLALPMRDGARWARLLLTVLAAPAELVLLRQVTESLFTRAATDGGVVQGVLGLCALGAIPVAVMMMYGPSARPHFHADLGYEPRNRPWPG